MDFEDTYDTHREWHILCGLDPVRKRPGIAIAEPNVFIQFDILDLSLLLCYLFLFNYVPYKKIQFVCQNRMDLVLSCGLH